MKTTQAITDNVTGANIFWRGGNGSVGIFGGYASATTVLQASLDGGITFIPMVNDAGTAISATANKIMSFNIAPCLLRSATTGGTVAAGTAQVETMTIAAPANATASGILVVTVTSAILTGSPLAINVPIVNGDTPSMSAARVRDVLQRRTEINALYAVGGTAGTVTLTKRAPFLANDTTLNLAFANGSPSPGITAAASSANTTAGVVQTPALVFVVSER